MAMHQTALVYTPPKRQPKTKSRPKSEAFKAAAERLDLVNGMAGNPRAPAIIDILSENEHDDLAFYENHAPTQRDR